MASEEDFWGKWHRLEQLLLGKFPSAGVYLFEPGDQGKVFGVEVEDDSQVGQVVEFLIAFRDANEPEAAVGIGDLLHAPVPVARLTFGKEHLAIEQDPLAWYINRARVMNLPFGGLETLSRYFSSSDLFGPCGWLKAHKPAVLSPPEFWSKVYSGEGFERAEEKDHRNASDLARLIDEYSFNSEACDMDVFNASSRISKSLLVKIECSRRVFNSELFSDISRIVRRFNPKWAVRFSVFEDLLSANSYLGGVITSPGGLVFVEG